MKPFRITLVATGSRGDAQPACGLAVALQARGHKVVVATHPPFETWVRSLGLEFRPVRGNPHEILQDPEVRETLESFSISGLMKAKRLMKSLFGPLYHDWMIDSAEAAKNADLLIHASVNPAGYCAAEANRIPAVGFALQPMTRSRYYPNALTKTPPLGAVSNVLSHRGMEMAWWSLVGALINEKRQSLFGLPPVSSKQWHEQHYSGRMPLLNAFSRFMIPPPPDFPAWHPVVGPWFLNHAPDYRPPAPLAEFLKTGTKPIYVGVGSMVDDDPAAFTRMIVQASEESKQRVVLSSGWSGLGQSDLPKNIHLVGDVPHSWLMDHMAGGVSHGGAGTTAAILRAGIPCFVVPFMADQPFWGKRVHQLGVAPKPIPRKKLTAESLGRALSQMASDKAMRGRAETLGTSIRSEDGLANAIAVIENEAQTPRLSRAS